MGSGMCRVNGGRPRVSPGVDGLYRKIVFNYTKQWTRSTENNLKSRTDINMKNKKKRRQKEKLIISGPFPADPNRLEGDKWRYVILTQLDTEPPPERPPRSRRRRSLRQLHGKQDVTSGCGHLGSVRRRSLYRGSGRRRPLRPGRRDTAVHVNAERDADQKKISAAAIQPVSSATVKYTRRHGFFESVDGVMAIVDNMF